jgi:hypothetical protein
MKITKGFIVACMNCHSQLGTAVDTHEEAESLARIHFSAGDKPHDGHTITITPTELVRK